LTQSEKSSIDTFIDYLARKIAILYPNNCADVEDYIQAGHLKLAEIRSGGYNNKNLLAYYIIAVSRAMRITALEAMCTISAPTRVKKQIHILEMLLGAGKTEKEICEQLQISQSGFSDLLLLSVSKSWHELFQEPMGDSEPFSGLDDLLSSRWFTEEDKTFILSQLNGNVSTMDISRKQRWLKAKNLRPKLARSGYGC
jgi:DNA-directed RNA polymerase specialized sigma subunit